MKTATKLGVTVLAVVFLALLLVATRLYNSYNSARSLAAQDAKRFTDSTYVGTRLSYSQIYTPPEFLRLPHWEVTYESTNSSHGFTRIVTLSEIRNRAKKVAE